ncbi:unnamed protein product, partial [marine sediment metagenome]
MTITNYLYIIVKGLMGQLKEIDYFRRADLEPGVIEDLGSGRV